MDEKDYKMIRFFNQLKKTINQRNIKSIGIITDKDGTIIINEELKTILQEIKSKRAQTDIHFIANTGRTVADMISALKKEKIPLKYFDYIIGDNGATCLDVKKNEEVFKNKMDVNDVNAVIEEFISKGGNIANIRLADGEHIYAYDLPEIREYYKKNKNVIFKQSFDDLEDMDITKLTLSGENRLILDIKGYIEKVLKKGKAHLGQTSFPQKKDNNYRVDFTRRKHKRNSSKICEKKREYRCVYIFRK